MKATLKKMMSKKLFLAVIAGVLTTAIAIGGIFAWFTASETLTAGEFTTARLSLDANIEGIKAYNITPAGYEYQKTLEQLSNVAYDGLDPEDYAEIRAYFDAQDGDIEAVPANEQLAELRNIVEAAYNAAGGAIIMNPYTTLYWIVNKQWGYAFYSDEQAVAAAKAWVANPYNDLWNIIPDDLFSDVSETNINGYFELQDNTNVTPGSILTAPFSVKNTSTIPVYIRLQLPELSIVTGQADADLLYMVYLVDDEGYEIEFIAGETYLYAPTPLAVGAEFSIKLVTYLPGELNADDGTGDPRNIQGVTYAFGSDGVEAIQATNNAIAFAWGTDLGDNIELIDPYYAD